METGGIRHENQDDRIWNHIFDTWTSAIGQMFFFRVHYRERVDIPDQGFDWCASEER